MKLNSDRALEIGRALWLRYGRNWEAVREAGIEQPDGVIDLTHIQAMTPEQTRCAYEWSTVNDPPCHPSDAGWSPCPLCREATRDNTPVAWLIEETWSGFVHYVHHGFDCVKWATECRLDDWRRRIGLRSRMRVPIVTKNVEEAMRFPTKDDADLWLALQPLWMSTGGQYQVREHMWPKPAAGDQELVNVRRG